MNNLYVPKCVKCDDLIENLETMYQGDSNEYCELCGIEHLTKHQDGFYYDPEDDEREPYFLKEHLDQNDYKQVVMSKAMNEHVQYEYNAIVEAVAKWFEYDTRTLRKMIENHHISAEKFQEMCNKLDSDIFKDIFLEGGLT
jgi:hypothetical protein